VNAPLERYPLAWPDGWKRTIMRTRAKFSKSEKVYRDGQHVYNSQRALTVGDGLTRLNGELKRLGATHVTISSNLRLRQDGLPTASQSAMLEDPGVAVYFMLKGKPRVLACDRWASAAENLAAIAGHIDAIRTVDRYGVGTIEQAFAGYTALPAQAGSWFVVLEFTDPPKEWDVVQTRYRELMAKHHPDRAGAASVDIAKKLGEAYATAKQEFGR